MTNFTKITAGVFSAIALMAAASTASADVYDHLDTLALRVKFKGNALTTEVRAHYSHTPYYRHLLSDSYEVASLADKVHLIAHHHRDIYLLDAYLTRLDRLFHHVEDLIAATERAARYGHGHVHCDTRHVKRLMHDLEDCLHHMLTDVKQLKALHRRPVYDPGCPSTRPVVRPVVRRPVHDHHDVHRRSSRSSGRSVNFGSFRISLGR